MLLSQFLGTPRFVQARRRVSSSLNSTSVFACLLFLLLTFRPFLSLLWHFHLVSFLSPFCLLSLHFWLSSAINYLTLSTSIFSSQRGWYIRVQFILLSLSAYFLVLSSVCIRDVNKIPLKGGRRGGGCTYCLNQAIFGRSVNLNIFKVLWGNQTILKANPYRVIPNFKGNNTHIKLLHKMRTTDSWCNPLLRDIILKMVR